MLLFERKSAKELEILISVGIDVSKEKSTVCIVRPHGEVVVPPYDIVHTEDALQD